MLLGKIYEGEEDIKTPYDHFIFITLKTGIHIGMLISTITRLAVSYTTMSISCSVGDVP